MVSSPTNNQQNLIYENIISYYSSQFITTIAPLFPDTHFDELAITLEPPKNPQFGDLATNIAMVLAKIVKKSPKDIALSIMPIIQKQADVAHVEIAGGGFINVTLHPHIWLGIIDYILKNPDHYGRLNIGNNEKVNIEYVSANPTGPIHIGHARGAVMGDVLANIYDYCGYDVTREYYVNDAGSQITTLAHSLYYRYQEYHQKHPLPMPEHYYPGAYLKDIAHHIAQEHGEYFLDKDEDEYIPLFKKMATEAMLTIIKDDLAHLGIHHDEFISEQSLINQNMVQQTIDSLSKNHLIYKGVLPPPKGQKDTTYDSREQLLFQSTLFGDDCDRALQKHDGEWTYFASDMANHFYKYQRGFKKMIDIFGADHAGYIKRIESATYAVSEQQAHLKVISAQMVRFMDGGVPLKMSKRSGHFITLRDLTNQIDVDAIRLFMLGRKADTMLDIDIASMVEENNNNPVFYLHYAHARTYSVEQMACDIFGKDMLKHAQSYEAYYNDFYTSSVELQLLKKIAYFPRILMQAHMFNEPHRIVSYMLDLAGQFHSLWTLGRDDTSLRFIDAENKEKTQAKLALLYCFRYVMQRGASIIGFRLKQKL